MIQKINNRLPTQATKIVVQLLYHGQPCFISAQLNDNDDLRGVLETIVQHLELNSVKLYIVIEIIPQPQPLCPQPQLPSPQPLLYNNLHTTTLKHKMPMTFIFHTHNYYPTIIIFMKPKKPPLTNKIISHHNILRYPIKTTTNTHIKPK